MRKKAVKHTTLPDPKFGDVQVTKFVNNLMYDGKKNKSFDIFYDAIDMVAEKTGEDGLEIFRKALTNVTPQVEVRSRRVGGANFQIPQPVREGRKVSLAMKWLIGYSRGRFIIQQDGLPTLVIPAWPEIERVTEDCRA